MQTLFIILETHCKTDYPHEITNCQWRETLTFSLMLANRWTHNRVAGNLTHHDVAHMELLQCTRCQQVISILRDFVYTPRQWEATLHRNVVCYWLGAYTKWSLPPLPTQLVILRWNSIKLFSNPEGPSHLRGYRRPFCTALVPIMA